MNTKAVGERTEGVLLAHLLKLGKSVALPFGNNQRYDLVVDDGDKLLKAQCKTGRMKNGCVVFWACSTNGFTGKKTGYRGQVDVFLVHCPDTDKFYQVPAELVGVTMVTLRVNAPRNLQKCDIRWAKDFEI
jgi:hypothetical protein